MPRPLLLTKTRATRILKALKIGATRQGAANVAGVNARTLFDWLRRGRNGEAPFAAFVAQIDAQRDAWEVTALEVITKAARKSWTAAAWKLERLKPKRYARRADEQLIEKKVEERLQAVLKHAEEEMRRRMAAGNAQQRLLEGKDDGQRSTNESRGRGPDGRDDKQGPNRVDD